jgi:hypothetical protein
MRLEARLKALEETMTPRHIPDDGKGAELFAEICAKARAETQRDQDAEEHLTKDQHKESLYRAIDHANKQAEHYTSRGSQGITEFSFYAAKANVRALTLEVAELEKAEEERAPDEREQETA